MAISSGADSPVQAIKERLGIEEVVSSYLKLEKAGVNLKAKCPFHSEKTPSFFVSPSRGSYYCFGCGAKGDIFTFVEEFEGLDFKGALNLLAGRAGIELPKWRGESHEAFSEKERLYEIMLKATEYYSGLLEGNKKAREYLKSRGLLDKTVESFKIGYAPESWSGLYNRFRKSYSDSDLEKAGLIKKGEKGYYDRFRSRIMFPVSDSSGRIVAFSGRVFPEEAKEGNGLRDGTLASAKYLNSPETPIFKKSSILYGLDKAKDSIRKNDFSIVVEGQFDLLMSHQAGFRNTLATLGTALAGAERTEEGIVNNLGVIKRLSPNVVFVFDPDKAGLAAALRAAATALSLDMNVKGAVTMEGYDPADLILKKGPDAWRETIRNAKHIIEFLLDRLLAEPQKDPLKIKLLIGEKIIPYLAYIGNPIKKSHFISLISGKTGMREEDIRESLVRKERENEENFPKKKEEEQKATALRLLRKDYILRRLLGLVLWQKEQKNPALDTEEIMLKISSILRLPEREILALVRDQESDLIFEAEAFYVPESDVQRDSNELLANLEEERLKAELADLLLKLQKAESSGEKEKSEKFLKEINEISKNIQKIKNGRRYEKNGQKE